VSTLNTSLSTSLSTSSHKVCLLVVFFLTHYGK
jgi:hypothetical protein